MRIHPSSVLRTVIVLAACATAASAKEPTRKLVISGGRLASSIELTDSVTLAWSDLYAGNFLGAPRGSIAPAADLPRYEISFYLPDEHRRGHLRRAYVVYFVRDPARAASYVYVPGTGDTWASWNHGVIIRADREGRWSEATTEWARRISDAITHARRLPAPSCSVADSARLRPADPTYRDATELTDTLESRSAAIRPTWFCARGVWIRSRRGSRARSMELVRRR